MRFQSNASFSKLAPTFVADPYGACASLNHSTANGVAESILGPPASGYYYELRNISINADTTVDTTAASIRITGTATNTYIVGGYARAIGVWVVWTGVLPIVEGLSSVNTTAVSMGIHIYYRNIPFPS